MKLRFRPNAYEIFLVALVVLLLSVALLGEPAIGQDTRVTLLDRYDVEISFQVTGHPIQMAGVSERSYNSALFHWWREENFEVLVKMVDACDLAGRSWLFIAAASSITHDVRVTDQNTGQEHVYRMELDDGGLMVPIIDTARWVC